jgi:peptidoglycan/xylan/chitin deacetylase (PgdA/CDA1 family)
VLFYHRVADDPLHDLAISPQRFEQQISWMQQRFDLISLAEVQRRIRDGNPRPAISITFDDGYADNCSFALPLLIERKIPVTYFVCTHQTTCHKPFPHDLSQRVCPAANSIESLRALSRAGVEIGGHTRNHVDLGQPWTDDVLYDELIVASRDMQTMIGSPIRYFSFPFGQKKNLHPRVFQLLKREEFAGVCSAYGGLNEIGGDEFHLQRIPGDANFARMKNWLSGDPRLRRVERYEWRAPLTIAKTASTPVSMSACDREALTQ